MTESDLVTARDLACTYNGGTYSDPWAAVLDYQAVMRYASHHPN